MFMGRMPSKATPRSTSTVVTRSAGATGPAGRGAGNTTGGSSSAGWASTDMRHLAGRESRAMLLRRSLGDLDAADGHVGPVGGIVERADADAARRKGLVR